MLFRLLIFTIGGIVVYRAVKSWLGGTEESGHRSEPPDRVDDVMVKDPVCGTYFAQRKGIALTTSNEVLYFCSNDCRDRYTAEQTRS